MCTTLHFTQFQRVLTYSYSYSCHTTGQSVLGVILTILSLRYKAELDKLAKMNKTLMKKHAVSDARARTTDAKVVTVVAENENLKGSAPLPLHCLQRYLPSSSPPPGSRCASTTAGVGVLHCC